MMKSKFNGFLKKLRKEAADSATFVIITAMPFVLLFAGWAIDFTKNAAIHGEYSNIAQESAQAAIRVQDGAGSLMCGQTQADTNNDSVITTKPITLVGASNAERFVRDATQGSTADNRLNAVQAKNAGSLQLAVASYLQKSGRRTSGSGGFDSVYTGGAEQSINGTNNSYGNVSARNDGRFVENMRSIVGSDSQRQDLDNNKTDGMMVGLTAKNTDTFTIKVWCSKGVSNDTSDRKDTAGQKGTVGSAKMFNTINMEIHDWSGNFVMGMFDRNWVIQRYNIQARAIASWSKSAVN